jgi:hypothetical protein
MRLRFFTLANSFLFFVAAGLLAQQSTPAPKVGYIRFWNMLPPQNGSFEVRKISGPGTEETVASATAYRYSSYRELNNGRYRLGVFKTATNAPLKIFDVDLKPETYFTILVSPQSIDMFDETNDPKATSGTLTIRNYFSGLTVTASADNEPIGGTLAYGQSFTAAGFPLKRLRLTLRTHLPNGTPAESEAEADFIASKRATVLIIPDSYGRFRPRATIDGKNL